MKLQTIVRLGVHLQIMYQVVIEVLLQLPELLQTQTQHPPRILDLKLTPLKGPPDIERNQH